MCEIFGYGNVLGHFLVKSSDHTDSNVFSDSPRVHFISFRFVSADERKKTVDIRHGSAAAAFEMLLPAITSFNLT